jgi:hypothetical protein
MIGKMRPTGRQVLLVASVVGVVSFLLLSNSDLEVKVAMLVAVAVLGLKWWAQAYTDD